MNHELVLANLNLYAVLPNLEELVKHDPKSAALTKDWNICIQFRARNGPCGFVEFINGSCCVGRGRHSRPTVKLFFVSCGHMNKMFEGKSQPIPLKGFTRLGFLAKEFSKLTDRMEYFLKPTDELLKDPDYLKLNTMMTMHTAGRAVAELAANDHVGKLIASSIMDGSVLMKILPDGPAVTINFKKGRANMKKGEIKTPTACMLMKNLKIANGILNQKIDAFTAIASGDMMIKGQTPMLDAMDLILERIPHYLEP